MPDDFVHIPHMLIIGGAVRNVGKTSLTVKIIEEFATQVPIIALKVKTIREGESFFHGNDRNPLQDDEPFRISETTDIKSNEDTSRMLRAGAKRVFHMKVKSRHIPPAFAALWQLIPEEKPVFICESNSLRKHIRPGLFLLIRKKDSDEMKPSAVELLHLADKIIYTDGVQHDFDVNRLCIANYCWKIDCL